MSDYFKLSATELISLIKTGQLSVAEVIASHFRRIAEVECNVKAWIHLDREKAFQNAVEIDRQLKEGKFRGNLYGIPIGIKDIFNTYDMPTCMGSPLWAGFLPGNDARVVHYLRMKGAIFPGKTVTAEFAVHAPGETRNPHNTSYSPGTSSSGSAAAVAACMVPVALGTQTAGSIMRPASYCGVYGFKPSFGLIPRTGVLKTVETLDSIGLFARCSKDLELIFDMIRVRGHNFPISDTILNDPSRQEKGERHWRVALIPEFNERFSQPYALEALKDFLTKLDKNPEVDLVSRELPDGFFEAQEIHEIIYEHNLSIYFQREFGSAGYLSQIIYDMMSRGKQITMEEFESALDKQKRLSNLLDGFFKESDIIVTLTTQGIAPKFMKDDIPDTCLIWTLCGVPVINIPLFSGPNGMPFGMQIISRRYNDYLLLKFADFLDELIKNDLTES